MEEFEDKLDKQYPRDYSWRRALVLLLGTFISGLIVLSVLAALFSSCSPIITAPHGYVIKANTHQVAVEHERMDKPGYGVVRYYEFPFGHGYVVGDSVNFGYYEGKRAY